MGGKPEIFFSPLLCYLLPLVVDVKAAEREHQDASVKELSCN